MNGKPPVCPISRSQAISGMPGLREPPIPKAHDLPTAIAALNQIAMLLPQITPLAAAPNNFPTPTDIRSNDGPEQDGGGSKRIKMYFRGRIITEDVVIEDPDDPDNTVTIKRIRTINWRDDASSSKVDWGIDG